MPAARKGKRTRLWTRETAALAALFAMLWGAETCPGAVWNNPYPAADGLANVLYTSFRERPKHLDPVSAYGSNEYTLIAQILEPPLQYHYLKRPFQLVPLTAEALPEPQYFDAAGQPLPKDAALEDIARSVYEITIQPGIRYQPHPALARDEAGRYRYHTLPPGAIDDVRRLADLPETGTRELVAADYVYQIKRLAHPKLHSPIAGLMMEHILGLQEYAKILKDQLEEPGYLDLRRYRLAGAQVVDRYRYRITLKGKYPQFIYWLAMPFFAPIPWEAERFYAQPGLAERNITLDWYPIGTGPFMLIENDPNRRMVLARNPSFRDEIYPLSGEPEDGPAGLLADAGRPLPFLDRVVFSLEKESIPYWTKFLQGYYDSSGVSSDSFDEAIRFNDQGDPEASPAMAEKGTRLLTAVSASIYYTGFNMRDPVVGGLGDRARRLRQAIAIAVDQEEYISIFANGRGVAAQGPLPQGIFGHRPLPEGLNRRVYDWVDGAPRRKTLAEARALLARAGYPNGRDQATGKPLVLYLDSYVTGPEGKARLDWLRKQLAKLDIQLVVRATDYNRFQEKMRKGTAQIFQWGWNADYPDPENFLFLLHGPNAKALNQGENAANYENPAYDRLFEQMKHMENGPERLAVIDEMVEMLRHDSPWLWGYHPKEFLLHHAWYHNAKHNLMANNTLKYIRIDPAARQRSRTAWNRPVWWPIAALAVLGLLAIAPAVWTHRRRERAPAL